MKKRIFALSLFFSVLINVLPLFFLKEKIRWGEQSYVALAMMILVSANGILSYVFRHKGNYLSFGAPKSSLWWSRAQAKKITESKEYKERFLWQLLIYLAVIPFYIPCICFIKTWTQTLWLLCLIFLPQVIFILMDIKDMLREIKEQRAKEEIREQELREQEKREELGRYK